MHTNHARRVSKRYRFYAHYTSRDDRRCAWKRLRAIQRRMIHREDFDLLPKSFQKWVPYGMDWF